MVDAAHQGHPDESRVALLDGADHREIGAGRRIGEPGVVGGALRVEAMLPGHGQLRMDVTHTACDAHAEVGEHIGRVTPADGQIGAWHAGLGIPVQPGVGVANAEVRCLPCPVDLLLED